jgi:hypothetical protein
VARPHAALPLPTPLTQRPQADLNSIPAPGIEANGVELTQTLLGRLHDARIGRVEVREPTLEDAYVDLVTEA